MCYIGGFPAWAYKYTMHASGSHDDVPTEWEFSRIISAYNAFKDADAIGYGALANASFGNISLPKSNILKIGFLIKN